MALITEHPALRSAIKKDAQDVPSVYPCYRFTAKLRAYSEIFDRCGSQSIGAEVVSAIAAALRFDCRGPSGSGFLVVTLSAHLAL